jgi:hypothetical protein
LYIRAKIVKDAIYYQVVEGYRDGTGRVRHRNVIALGQSPDIEAAIEETRRLERRDRRRLKILESTFPDPATIPGRARRETERLRARLTRQQEYRAALQEVSKRFWS